MFKQALAVVHLAPVDYQCRKQIRDKQFLKWHEIKDLLYRV